jgi:iron complex outermembrane receptor protein
MPFVPSLGASFGASWLASRGTLAVTASRSWDWVVYGSGAPGSEFFGTAQGREMSGGSAAFSRSFDGAPKIGLDASILARPDFSILLGVKNLLDSRIAEPNSFTIVPGRSFSVGLKANF